MKSQDSWQLNLDYARNCTYHHDHEGNRMNQKPLLVLIAGPYRSGTNDDPVLIAANLEKLESYALPIFRLGHIPLIGEWVALPIIREAGGKQIGDAVHQQYLYPVASR